MGQLNITLSSITRLKTACKALHRNRKLIKGGRYALEDTLLRINDEVNRLSHRVNKQLEEARR